MFFLIAVDPKTNTIDYNNTIVDNKKTYYHKIYDANAHDDVLLTEMFSYKNMSIKFDDGWSFNETSKEIVWYKGYSTEEYLPEIAKHRRTEQFEGHYCIIVFNKITETISIHHDNTRGFPIYYTDSIVTNMYPMKMQVTHDQKIIIEDRQIMISPTEFSYDISDIKNDLDAAVVAEMIVPILMKKLDGLIKYNNIKNLEVQSSDGLDTATVRSLLDYRGISYELLKHTDYTDGDHEGINWTYDSNAFMAHIAKYTWGFTQTNYYEQEVWVASGFWGDETFARNPLRVSWILKHYGIDFLEEYDKVPGTYMEGFIRERYAQKIPKYDYKFDNKVDLYQRVVDWSLDDYQMFHLNKTTIFTPLKGLDLLLLTFRMNNDALLKTVTDGELQKQIIKILKPELLSEVAAIKNGCEP